MVQWKSSHILNSFFCAIPIVPLTCVLSTPAAAKSVHSALRESLLAFWTLVFEYRPTRVLTVPIPVYKFAYINSALTLLTLLLLKTQTILTK